MRSVYYLSSISFVQVDLAVLPALSKQFKVIYGLIVPTISKNNVPLEQIQHHCKENNIELRTFKFFRRLRDARIGIEFWRVLRDIANERPDVLYMTSQDVPFLSLLCLTLNKRNTIIAIHDVQFHSNSRFGFLMRWSRNMTISHFDAFHVFSKNQQKIFANRFPDKKSTMIPLSLGYYGDLESNSNDRHDDYDAIRFLFFGNILAYKGLKSLLNTIEILRKRHNKFRLTIAGQCTNWKEEYEPLINAASPVNCIIRFIDAEMIPSLFLDAHYLVLPYSDATQSGPLMLAYRFGLPVIASNIAAFQECVENNVSGFLYEPSDTAALERVMESAIMREKSEYVSLRNSLKEYVNARFSVEEISRQYANMFIEKLSVSGNR